MTALGADRNLRAQRRHADLMGDGLIGTGLYTPAEAGRLVDVAPARIARWLRGHIAAGRRYEPLWRPQVDMDDGSVMLGFRDLMEVRVAAAFIARGLHPLRVRRAVALAREILGKDHPLSTRAFRTDGRSVFLQVVEEEEQPALIDLFRKQYAFREIVERSLSHVDYDEAGVPACWWPLGRAGSVLVDPARSFGQPVEAETSVPVAALVGAVKGEGSPEAAARAWDVPIRAVRSALAFDEAMERKAA